MTIAHDVAVESGMAHESLSALAAVIQEGIDRALEGIDRALAARVSPDREALRSECGQAGILLAHATERPLTTKEAQGITGLLDRLFASLPPAEPGGRARGAAVQICEALGLKPSSDRIAEAAAIIQRHIDDVREIGRYRTDRPAPPRPATGDGHMIERYISPHKLPTPRQRELLICLIEEASEIQKVACKLLRFGAEDGDPNPPMHLEGVTNGEALGREIGQLSAVSDMLVALDIVRPQDIGIGHINKTNKLPRFLQTEPDQTEPIACISARHDS